MTASGIVPRAIDGRIRCDSADRNASPVRSLSALVPWRVSEEMRPPHFPLPSRPVTSIEVSLAGTWASFVQSHRWHKSQESFMRGGRIHVRLRVRLCPEVVAWILGFGPDARVPDLGQVSLQTSATAKLGLRDVVQFAIVAEVRTPGAGS